MTTPQKLALVGYGKMGRLIEQLAPQHNFEVVLRLDKSSNHNAAGITRGTFHNIDAAIEFSTPEAAVSNLKALAQLGTPTACGTTGWLDHLPEVKQLVDESGAGLVHSPNFSTGVAVFGKLVALAAELLRDEESYGAWAWEIHHDQKKDPRSGTLLQLVRSMQKHGYARPIDVASNRAGQHPGTHEIGFDSGADTMILRHTARNREGFAHGALKAARWIIGRKGVFTFEDVLFGVKPT
jgi:4-hydroxy-tetrahydrodipicolinate reductase